jgi:hypothetical protein
MHLAHRALNLAKVAQLRVHLVVQVLAVHVAGVDGAAADPDLGERVAAVLVDFGVVARAVGLCWAELELRVKEEVRAKRLRARRRRRGIRDRIVDYGGWVED